MMMTVSKRRMTTNTILTNMFTILLFTLSVAFIGCDKDDDEVNTEVLEMGTCLVLVDGVFTELEIDNPVYLDGGDSGFLDNMYSEISYPQEARQDGVEGTCIIRFEITEMGTVENAIIVDDPGAGIGEETLESFLAITGGIAYSAGMLNGEEVRVQKEFSVRFRLE